MNLTNMDGILLIDKPKGWSSFDVIRKLRPILGVKKMGHAGTLDPLATGLLILLIGKATKQQDRFMKQDKVYEAELTIGATSTTEDAEGELTKISDKKPEGAEVKAALKSFIGELEQIPPQYSALKLGGQTAYKVARKGGTLELKARGVTVYDINFESYVYPKLSFTVKVSSGTYIRSLARDIGEKLGTGAYLSNLRRTQIGEFSIKEAISPELTPEEIKRAIKLAS